MTKERFSLLAITIALVVTALWLVTNEEYFLGLLAGAAGLVILTVLVEDWTRPTAEELAAEEDSEDWDDDEVEEAQKRFLDRWKDHPLD